MYSNFYILLLLVGSSLVDLLHWQVKHVKISILLFLKLFYFHSVLTMLKYVKYCTLVLLNVNN